MLCECGCGNETGTASRTDKRYGTIKGQPLRWCIGHHNHRLRLSVEEKRKRRKNAVKRWEDKVDYKNSQQYKASCRNSHQRYYKKLVPLGFECYKAMKRRCCNPKQIRYEIYGGAGIVVCDRWKHSFKSFLEDLGPRPSKEYSIGRALDLGNYEPGNAWWMSKEEQGFNKALKSVL